jgi:sigma-B regulation protein RsbU (phosphoserine phosphatase)
VTSRDEIGRLTAAFHNMRDSLKTHIRDLQETTAAKERLESELKVARRIQMDMLPEGTAGGPDQGYELAATLVPARAVGGDLYDHFQQRGRVFFLLGDVSGKGVPAALFMARTKTLFEVVAGREPDPGTILCEVNRGLCAENDAGMYVTVVCGTLDAGTGEVVFGIGGHDAPALLGPGRPAEFLKAEGGPVLGLLEVPAFPVNRVRLAPGETIVLFSDGVPEAFNEADEVFTHDRLLATRRARPDGAPGEIAEAVLAAVRAFAGAAKQSDDITVLALRRTLPPA